MDLVLDLNTSTNWVQIWEAQLSIINSTPELNKLNPFPKIKVPFLASSPILAIYSNHPTLKPSWNFGGYAVQSIQTGITVGGTPDSAAVRKKFFLREITLIFFERISTTYAIELLIPWWIRDLNVTIWGYNGIISSNTEIRLIEIQAALAALQQQVGSGGSSIEPLGF
jgi:hypothetical protein